MAGPRRPRVLLADDHPGIATAIGRLLAPHCEVVGTVTDGSELLEAAGRLQPDVIVLDLNMPNVNGLDACEQVMRAMPAMKVIVLTAVSDDEVMQMAFAVGACAFIAKQAIVDDLMPAISRAWADRSA